MFPLTRVEFSTDVHKKTRPQNTYGRVRNEPIASIPFEVPFAASLVPSFRAFARAA